MERQNQERSDKLKRDEEDLKKKQEAEEAEKQRIEKEQEEAEKQKANKLASKPTFGSKPNFMAKKPAMGGSKPSFGANRLSSNNQNKATFSSPAAESGGYVPSGMSRVSSQSPVKSQGSAGGGYVPSAMHTNVTPQKSPSKVEKDGETVEEEIPEDDDYSDGFEESKSKPHTPAAPQPPAAKKEEPESERDRINRLMRERQEKLAGLGGASSKPSFAAKPEIKKSYPWEKSIEEKKLSGAPDTYQWAP